MSLLITIGPEEPVLSFKAKKKPIHCSLTGPSPTWAKQLHEVAPPVEYPSPHPTHVSLRIFKESTQHYHCEPDLFSRIRSAARSDESRVLVLVGFAWLG